jgi:hypothetical protein
MIGWCVGNFGWGKAVLVKEPLMTRPVAASMEKHGSFYSNYVGIRAVSRSRLLHSITWETQRSPAS